jgi:hypothetical protein
MKLKMKKRLPPPKNANPFAQPLEIQQPPRSGEISDWLAERHKTETELIQELWVQLAKILNYYREGGEVCADLFGNLDNLRLTAEETWELVEDLKVFGVSEI